MENTIIRDFNEWFKSNEQRWKDGGVQATYKAIESKALVEITAESYLASIAVWDMGACDIIALSTVTDEEIWGERYDFQDFQEMTEHLKNFMITLAAHTAATEI